MDIKNFLNIVLPPTQDKPDFTPSWINNTFIPCELMFPEWIMARTFLTDFCNRTKYFGISGKECDIQISLDYPLVKDEISEELVSVVLFVPPEDREKVMGICNQLHQDYIPTEIYDFIFERNTEMLRYSILNKIKSCEQYLMSYRCRDVLSELKFRLGVLF